MLKEHFEDLLNPDGAGPLRADDSVTNVSIPVLDDPINPGEVVHVMEKQLKPNKSCGPDGLSPSIFKLLTHPWIAVITSLLSVIFFTGYPVVWMYAKLIMIFKKGDECCCCPRQPPRCHANASVGSKPCGT